MLLTRTKRLRVANCDELSARVNTFRRCRFCRAVLNVQDCIPQKVAHAVFRIDPVRHHTRITRRTRGTRQIRKNPRKLNPISIIRIRIFKKGSISFEDLQGVKLNDKQKRQIDHTLNDRTDHIDEKGIRNFLRLFSACRTGGRWSPARCSTHLQWGGKEASAAPGVHRRAQDSL